MVRNDLQAVLSCELTCLDALLTPSSTEKGYIAMQTREKLGEIKTHIKSSPISIELHHRTEARPMVQQRNRIVHLNWPSSLLLRL